MCHFVFVRQQLEDMAAKFNFPSMHQFAVEILRSDPGQRVTWLRRYYTSLNHPGLSNTVANDFPQADIAQSASSTSSIKAAVESHADTSTLQNHCQVAQRTLKYTRRNPKPKPGIPQNRVTSSQKNPRKPQTGVQEPHKNIKVPRKKVLDVPGDVPSVQSEWLEEMVCRTREHSRTKRASVSGPGASMAGSGIGSDRASGSGLGSAEAAAFADRDGRSSADFSHDTSATLSKPTAGQRQPGPKASSRTSKHAEGQRENVQASSTPERSAPSSPHSSFLADLIGDTSILDDLLKPKSRSAQPTPPCPPTQTCPAAPFAPRRKFSSASGSSASPQSNAEHTPPKGKRRDFWDVLAEGNQESMKRLTDPAEVRRVCINTTFAAGRRSGETESESLWKANERFLWRK